MIDHLFLIFGTTSSDQTCQHLPIFLIVTPQPSSGRYTPHNVTTAATVVTLIASLADGAAVVAGQRSVGSDKYAGRGYASCGDYFHRPF